MILSPQSRVLAAIERQALRCSRLAKALLDFSRTKPSARLRTSPEALLGTIFELSYAEARTQNVHLVRRDPAEPLPALVVSAQEIESALLNLLSNAIEATPEGRDVVLEAGAEVQDDVEGVRFRISDAGPGIPADIRSRIFDPFFTTKPVGQGTGLGLSLTRQIVLSHGGTIDLDPAEGQGTSIAVWLPADAGGDAESAAG